MKIVIAMALVPLVLMCGCVTPAVTQRPTQRVEFATFKTVAYHVRPSPAVEYGSGDEDMKYARETIDLLDSLLANKLKHMGYGIADATQTPDLVIDVSVTAIKPGSGAARFWVGFGAGRAVLTFDATFTDAHSTKVAAFQGGRSYTGMEMNVPAFPSHETLGLLAATRSVDQIATFIENGGSFPDEEKHARQTSTPPPQPPSASTN